MAKKKRVSVNSWEKYCSNYKNTRTNADAQEIKTDEINIEVRYSIGLEEALSIVNDTFDACVSDGAYVPFARDFAFKRFVLEKYTNLSFSESVEKTYDLIYGCDIFEEVLKRANLTQIEEIRRAIDEQISMYLNDLTNSVKSELSEIARTYSEILVKYRESSDVLQNIYTNADMVDLINKLGGIQREYDEEKIVDLILDRKESDKTPTSPQKASPSSSLEVVK